MVESPSKEGGGWSALNAIFRSLNRFIVEKIKNVYLASSGMDVIDISSSDGEDEMEVADGERDRRSLMAMMAVNDNGDVSQRLPMHISDARMSSLPLEKYGSTSNNGEYDGKHGFVSERRRTLPASLQGKRSIIRTKPSVSSSSALPSLYPLPRSEMHVHLAHPNTIELNGDDTYDDEVYVIDDGDVSILSSGNGKQHVGMGTEMSMKMESIAPQRLLPSWVGGKTFAERLPASFQSVELGGNREYPRIPSIELGGNREHPRIPEQAHLQHDERLIYEVALQDLAQPKFEVDLPNGLLSISLLRHQKIALAWLDQKEASGLPCSGGILADDQGLGKTVSMIALIQKQLPQQKKFMSSQFSKITSEMLNLDEDDKTTSDTVQTECTGGLNLPKSSLSPSSSASTLRLTPTKGRPAAGTLVVCPASILRQWAHELDEKVASSAKLSVLIYHGGTRTRSSHDLAKYDVVLTTYSIVTNEVPKKPLAGDDDGEQRNSEDYVLSSAFSTGKKRKIASSSSSKKKSKKKGSLLDQDGGGPLAGVRWFRVILDEAQIIKNHRTQVARSCCGLRAKRRWCLSGTPIQNTVDDIYSYFRFLKYEPYAAFASFSASIKAPILRNADTGYKKLQAILKTVMLRRTKGTIIDGKPILNLPPKSISLKKLSFTCKERTFYEGLEAGFRERFKRFAAEGTVKQNYASILLMLLRLRQACDHPLLVKDHNIDTSAKTSIETAKKLPKETLIRLLNQLEVLPLCVLCMEPPEDAVITTCGHVFCYQCISELLAGDENSCPELGCRSMIGEDSIFAKGTLKSCMATSHELAIVPSTFGAAEDISEWEEGYTSSKIAAALEILKSLDDSYKFQDASSEGNLPSKAIVFSQWTSMLDLIEGPLNYSYIQYRRLDGSMSLSSREQAVRDFYSDPEVSVMLMSLKAGNLGLNMIAACHVILLDLWWNPTSEDQAIDRAHRIGQTKLVTVHRLTIENTVEERILRLQEKKREMVSSAFGEDPSGRPGARLTVEDLRYLFQV